MNLRYKIFRWVRDFADKQMQKNYLKPYGGCDSCCPRCKTWEYQGNKIVTEPLEDGSDKRTCTKCNHTWLALFTPAGFISLNKNKTD